jgi:hypothetical protein
LVRGIEVKVTVVDALMGSGKTTVAFRMLAEMGKATAHKLFEEQDDGRRFIYLTPFLTEVVRAQREIGVLGHTALVPFAEHDRKLPSLNGMLIEGRNIITTHNLFARADVETREALQEHFYTLVIDEVCEWVERYPISKPDIRMLYQQGILSNDPESRLVTWTDPEGGYQGRFMDLRNLCQLGKIVAGRETTKVAGATVEEPFPALLIWQFPVDMLAAFERVIILTHLFDASDMSAYFRMHDVTVEKMTMSRQRDHFITYDAALEQERTAKLAPLIKIVSDPALNAIGEPKGRTRALSESWFRRDQKTGGKRIAKLRTNLRGFFRTAGTRTVQNMWSTYKSYRADLVDPKGNYAKGFVELNSRATNAHRGRIALAYCVNLYRHPLVRGYFEDRGVTLSEDAHALLIMTQWIFRSAIRDGKEVLVYLPSARMRRLLVDWLAGQVPTGTTGEPDDADGEDLISDADPELPMAA